MAETTLLFRPVGQKELDLIRNSKFTEFPPRMIEVIAEYRNVEYGDTIQRMAKEESSNDQDKPCVGGEQMSEAEIDYNVMGTFPASDPPSWTLGVRPHKTCSEEFEGEKPSPNDPSHKNEPAE